MNKHLTKIIAQTLCLLMLLAVCAGCGDTSNPTENPTKILQVIFYTSLYTALLHKIHSRIRILIVFTIVHAKRVYFVH